MTNPPARAIGVLLALSGVAGGLGALLDLAGVDSPIRAVLVVFFFAVAPTIAIAGLLGRFDPFARVVLAFTCNVALVALVAILLLSQGIWSPGVGFVVMAAITSACLTWQHPRWYRHALDRATARRGGAAHDPDGVATPSSTPSPVTTDTKPVAAAVRTGPADFPGPGGIDPNDDGAVLLDHMAEFQDALSSELADLIRVSERLRASGDESRRKVGEALLHRAKEMAATAEAESARRLESAREELERPYPIDEDLS